MIAFIVFRLKVFGCHPSIPFLEWFPVLTEEVEEGRAAGDITAHGCQRSKLVSL